MCSWDLRDWAHFTEHREPRVSIQTTSLAGQGNLIYKEEFVCLSVCLSVCLFVCLSLCPAVTRTFLHASTSCFTYNLILAPERFSHAFRPTLPFIYISAITLTLIQATILISQFSLSRLRGCITLPLLCSNIDCQWLSC